MWLNGIRHSTSAPYHPVTNGLAERAVQTFKTYLKEAPSMALEDLISRFLLTYRITPHSTVGTSPAEFLFSCRPRTRLDLVLPDLSARVCANQQRQNQFCDQHTKHRFFRSGDAVFVCDLPSKTTGRLEPFVVLWEYDCILFVSKMVELCDDMWTI